MTKNGKYRLGIGPLAYGSADLYPRLRRFLALHLTACGAETIIILGSMVEVFQVSEPFTLEARLEAVERDLAELKDLVRRTPEVRPWYESTVGSMKDYPEFADVVRLGRELREAENDDVSGPAE